MNTQTVSKSILKVERNLYFLSHEEFSRKPHRVTVSPPSSSTGCRDRLLGRSCVHLFEWIYIYELRCIRTLFLEIEIDEETLISTLFSASSFHRQFSWKRTFSRKKSDAAVSFHDLELRQAF